MTGTNNSLDIESDRSNGESMGEETARVRCHHASNLVYAYMPRTLP